MKIGYAKGHDKRQVKTLHWMYDYDGAALYWAPERFEMRIDSDALTVRAEYSVFKEFDYFLAFYTPDNTLVASLFLCCEERELDEIAARVLELVKLRVEARR